MSGWKPSWPPLAPMSNALQGNASMDLPQPNLATSADLGPVILALPKYMTGEMSLGSVMQLATAFVQVQMALNWIVDNFVRFAELRASANRVGELVWAMDGLDGPGVEAMPVGARTEGEAAAMAPVERS